MTARRPLTTSHSTPDPKSSSNGPRAWVSMAVTSAEPALVGALIISDKLELPSRRIGWQIADFPHLLRADAKQGIREKIRIDLDKGIIETDTLEEAKEAQRITANMAKARQAAAATGMAAVLPMAKCGTNLEKAKDDFLAERKATLKDSTWRKHRGVLQAFIKAKGNIGSMEQTAVGFINGVPQEERPTFS